MSDNPFGSPFAEDEDNAGQQDFDEVADAPGDEVDNNDADDGDEEFEEQAGEVDEEVVAEEADVELAEEREHVEECAEEASVAFSMEQLLSVQQQLAKALAENDELRGAREVASSKLEAVEKELEATKTVLSQLQQAMVQTISAAPISNTEAEGVVAGADTALPSFDAVDLALRLEEAERRLLEETTSAERAAARAAKWEEEAKLLMGMYHEVAASRYTPLLTQSGVANLAASQQHQDGAGTKVVEYFSRLLRGDAAQKITPEDDGDFSPRQREILLDYILACGYELQFMMMRAHVAQQRAKSASEPTRPPAPVLLGVKRGRDAEDSAARGLLGELVKELSDDTAPKRDLSSIQITPASTSTVNALRAHVGQCDRLERAAENLERQLAAAKSLSANPLFSLGWDGVAGDASNGTTVDSLKSELQALEGRNRILTGACKMYFKRSQQLLVELVRERATGASFGSLPVASCVAASTAIAAYVQAVDSIRSAHVSRLEEMSLNAAAKLATLSSTHSLFVQQGGGAGATAANPDLMDESAPPASDLVSIVAALAQSARDAHQVIADLKTAVAGSINATLTAPLNEACARHFRDVGIFAKLLIDADRCVLACLGDEGESVAGGLDSEHLTSVVEGILKGSPALLPTIPIPSTLSIHSERNDDAAIMAAIHSAASSTVASAIATQESALRTQSERTEFVISKVASLLSTTPADGNRVAKLAKELQDAQSAQRTASAAIATTNRQLTEANAKLQAAIQAHAKAKADFEKETKSHAEARSMLKDSQSRLSKNSAASQAQLIEQKGKFEAKIAELDSTVEDLRTKCAVLEEQLAEARREEEAEMAADDAVEQNEDDASPDEEGGGDEESQQPIAEIDQAEEEGYGKSELSNDDGEEPQQVAEEGEEGDEQANDDGEHDEEPGEDVGEEENHYGGEGEEGDI